MDDEPVAGGGPEQGSESRDRSRDYDARLAHFIGLLADDRENIRWSAAEMLGRIGDVAAVGELIDTLWDDDARVRLKAAWALGQIGDTRAIPPLKRLYRMEKDDAKEIIQEALEAINRRQYQG